MYYVFHFNRVMLNLYSEIHSFEPHTIFILALLTFLFKPFFSDPLLEYTVSQTGRCIFGPGVVHTIESSNLNLITKNLRCLFVCFFKNIFSLKDFPHETCSLVHWVWYGSQRK